MTVKETVQKEMAKRPPLPEPSERQALRKKARLTQVALAGIVGVDRKMISQYENGIAEPTGARRLRYVEALNVMADETAP